MGGVCGGSRITNASPDLVLVFMQAGRKVCVSAFVCVCARARVLVVGLYASPVQGRKERRRPERGRREGDGLKWDGGKQTAGKGTEGGGKVGTWGRVTWLGAGG